MANPYCNWAAGTIINSFDSPQGASMMHTLHLLHLCSPALPIGAYAYSQGLEYAIDSGWLKNPAAIADWLLGVMDNTLSFTDLPILHRLYEASAAGDQSGIDHWNHYLRACRESRELLLEDEQLGAALARLLKGLSVPLSPLTAPPTYASQFAQAGVFWGIPLASLSQGFLWAWLENQVAAATKLVPLGQSQGQQILAHLMPHIPTICVAAASRQEDELGRGLPGLAMASSLHESQYSRLFRS